jgi:hypothetical protein
MPETTYRIRKISDPRSRGACHWFEIEAARGGETWHVATVDTRQEARATIAAIEAAEAQKAAGK